MIIPGFPVGLRTVDAVTATEDITVAMAGEAQDIEATATVDVPAVSESRFR
jgi:hypothetical protein